MKKAAILIFCAVLLCGCSPAESLFSTETETYYSSDDEKMDITGTSASDEIYVNETADYKAFYTPLESDEKVVFYSYNDYDSDETYEAFAVTQSKNGSGYGKLWFIKGNISEMLLDKLIYDDAFVFSPDGYGKKFICFRTDDEQYSRIWGVKDGNVFLTIMAMAYTCLL